MRGRLVYILLLGVIFSFGLKKSLAAQVIESKSIDFIVDSDGNGDFKTIQEAINAVPDFRKVETVILVKNGVYKEKIVLPASKTHVTLIGQDPLKTIITYDDYAQKKNRFGEDLGTTGSSGFFIFADNFCAENICFQNSAGPVGQAVAVRVDGDQVIFKNCRFLGNQDTLYLHGKHSRQYYTNCYIEGTVDFIFGWSTAVFDHCRIFCKKGGYVTAASTDSTSRYGFVFRDCQINGQADKNTFYLGRPWRPYAKVVYLNCYLGDFIKPEGWFNWGKESNEKTAFYAEYHSKGPGANPKLRVPWSHQLSEKNSHDYTLDRIFGKNAVVPAFESDWIPMTN